MKGEIYNFILHSDIGTGSSVANKFFFVDWNRIPDSRYKLTFSFTSSSFVPSTTFDAILYISELGCSNNTICMAPSGSTAQNAGFIGIIRNYAATSYLEVNTIDNPPSYLRSKPRDNQINIRIHQNLSNQTTDYTPLPVRYTIMLSFEQLDDDIV